MLVTSRSLRANGNAAAVEAALGERLTGVYDQVQPHVPNFQVSEVIALAAEKNISAVIGMGGGSPIGMAKAVAFGLQEEQRTSLPALSPISGEPLLVPVIAIPATYAGSEMTAVVGVTHTRETPPRKITVSDPRIAPRLVIYDPRLTLDLPAEITASTGINALAHCFEALYSTTRHPLSSAAAVSGVRHIHNSLLRCYLQGQDLGARGELLLGAHLAGWSLSGVGMGLHHGLCHVLGGTANVPHGIANSILLPHVLRFNADVTAAQLLPAVEALGIPLNGLSPAAAVETAAGLIFELVGKMNLPQRLRDAGVKEADLPLLAQIGFQNRTVQNNPKPIRDVEQIESLLRAAW